MVALQGPEQGFRTGGLAGVAAQGAQQQRKRGFDRAGRL